MRGECPEDPTSTSFLRPFFVFFEQERKAEAALLSLGNVETVHGYVAVVKLELELIFFLLLWERGGEIQHQTTSYTTQHTRVKQNVLFFMQKGTQPRRIWRKKQEGLALTPATKIHKKKHTHAPQRSSHSLNYTTQRAQVRLFWRGAPPFPLFAFNK